MQTLPGLVFWSAVIGALGLAGCNKKKGDPSPVTPPAEATIDAATAPVTPTDPAAELAPTEATPVVDAPDEYKAIAELVIADLAKKDFDSFVKNAMVTTEQLKAMMEKGWATCPEIAPTEEEKPHAEQMLADYNPRGEAVKAGFDSCASRHDFAKASYQAASSREHVSMCGGEMADHVELTLEVGKEEVVVVLDDLVKTSDGWRLVDSGLSCADE